MAFDFGKLFECWSEFESKFGYLIGMEFGLEFECGSELEFDLVWRWKFGRGYWLERMSAFG